MADEEEQVENADGVEEEEKPEGEEGEEKADGEEAEDGEEGEEGEEKEEGTAGEDGAATEKPKDTGIKERIEKDPLELEFLQPLPEQISFNRIPRINDAKSVWRLGMRKIEECFAEHIANMHLDFEDKAREYETIQSQVETNHRFMEGFYVKMQEKMNEKYASIKIERDIWEGEKEEIRSLVKIDSEIVSLNIGGTHHIQTEKDVLQSVPGSTLSKMFSDMHELKKVEEEVFLDRDGTTFETLVNYLRNDRKVFPEFTEKNQENHFYKEMHYWGIDRQHRGWQEEYLKRLDRTACFDDDKGPHRQANYPVQTNQIQNMNRSRDSGSRSPRSPQPGPMRPRSPARTPNLNMRNRSPQQVFNPRDYKGSGIEFEGQYKPDHSNANNTMNSDTSGHGGNNDEGENPGIALRAVKEKWTELGPLKLEDIIANSTEAIDQSLKFGQSQYNKFIIGQVGWDGRVQGVGKEINHIIYEGQFKNDIYHGYGRYIYSNGNYYIGMWQDGKRSGWGKLVDKSGKIYEGMWQYSKFVGN